MSIHVQYYILRIFIQLHMSGTYLKPLAKLRVSDTSTYTYLEDSLQHTIFVLPPHWRRKIGT